MEGSKVVLQMFFLVSMGFGVIMMWNNALDRSMSRDPNICYPSSTPGMVRCGR